MLATYAIFGLNGLVFASWAARIPAASTTLGLGSGQMGGLLLVGAIGSVLALPLAGIIAARVGTANTVRIGGVAATVAASTVALGLGVVSVPVVAVGLFLFGCGIALWDVGQNIEGADVERRVGRTIMPRFHAAFSGGAFVGALVGAGLSALQVSLSAHLVAIAILSLAVSQWTPRHFLPEAHDAAAAAHGEGRPRGFGAWGEPRTLLIGLVVLGAALTEGAANDWVAKASVDGLGTSESTGAIMFAVFVAAMTALRFVGGPLIDRFGRVRVLQASLGSSLAGLVLFVVAPNVPLAAVGAILWGAGAALGFPMGMSAAADEPERAAARVSVVSTIGYTAFLAGPPLIGFLGDAVGIRNALLAVGVAVLASFLVAPAARERPATVVRTLPDAGPPDDAPMRTASDQRP
ncbi:MFS transporter [Arthrobacter agilis]|uniref:MFS transporter n=1 Tax=Arthrobacter agilis TaxID=37921 RepID=UPI000B3623A1|nr:MFS transporter [Arthrobacter agilis]OUM42262.1 MFS transporter [Arthrobacter agilis]PPB45603.1 MFS transporter [Arthrobacter agilis]TPV26618.1 MFS transporter [Arthrobacter agilis]VDR33689.1 Inner membrane protein ybjJ [Arthrobacter agilis]